MFDSKKTLTGRLTDAVDLMIDFATLGEYGLEPVEGRVASCETRRLCSRAEARPRMTDRGRGVAVRVF
jgi:hypothetical protein